jgi:hypothetical protein
VRWHIYIPWESVPDFITGEQDLEVVQCWFLKCDGRRNIHLTNPCKNSYSKWKMYIINTHWLCVFMPILMLWNFHDLTNFLLACRYHCQFGHEDKTKVVQNIIMDLLKLDPKLNLKVK